MARPLRPSPNSAARQRSAPLLAVILLGATLAGAAPSPGSLNRLTTEERTSGWEFLFDGVAAECWRGINGSPFPSGYWELRGRCLKTEPALIGRDLVSRDEFENFEFAFDWRLPSGGNSGVKYLVDESHEHPYAFEIRVGLALFCAILLIGLVLIRILVWNRRRAFLGVRPQTLSTVLGVLGLAMGVLAAEVLDRLEHQSTGLEIQLLSNDRHRDSKTPSRRAGALYDRIAPESSPVKPPGEWNTGRVKVDGLRVEHWINGDRVVSYEIGSDDMRRRIESSKFRGLSGFGAKAGRHIVLQHHQDEVCFRNLRIRRLP